MFITLQYSKTRSFGKLQTRQIAEIPLALARADAYSDPSWECTPMTDHSADVRKQGQIVRLQDRLPLVRNNTLR